MKRLPEETGERGDTQLLAFKGVITQVLPGGRGGFVTFDEPLKAAQRGFARASLFDDGFSTPKMGTRVEGRALANGAIVAEVLELHVDSQD